MNVIANAENTQRCIVVSRFFESDSFSMEDRLDSTAGAPVPTVLFSEGGKTESGACYCRAYWDPRISQ